MNPGDYCANYNRGRVYAKKGQPELAIADYNRAIQANPRFAAAYFFRAMAYFDQRAYDQAWKDVHQAQKLGFEVPSDFLETLTKASGRKK
jgi:tetratricopeptide (TPR) repeat protein